MSNTQLNGADTTLVVKRSGQRQSEIFSSEKLHSSIASACRSVRTPEGQADMTASRVVSGVLTWCNAHREITSADIRRKAADILTTLHDEAGYAYLTHKLIV